MNRLAALLSLAAALCAARPGDAQPANASPGVAENPVWPRPIIVPVPTATVGVAQPVITLRDNWLMLPNPTGDFWSATADTSAWTPMPTGGGRRGPGNGGGNNNNGASGNNQTAYRIAFDVPADYAGHRVVLRFNGVSNAAKIWVNGHFVREHWGSFMPFTCDVTEFVAWDQPNQLVVGVDNSRVGLAQFVRGGGLQREVKMFAAPMDYLTRFHLDTDLDAQYRDATLKVWLRMDFHEAERRRVKVALKNAQGEAVPLNRPDAIELSRATPETIVEFPIAQPLKWDAEHPNLYTLEVSVLGAEDASLQTLSRRFGFMKTERVGRRVLVNGQEIKLRGLWGGNSAKEMVEHNINHTRQKWATEELLDECDRLGVYVTDENPVDFAKSAVANDPQFQAQYLSFMADLLERDRDHPSIIMWGLDNESDFGRNVPATFRYVRAEDPRRTAMFSWGSHAPPDEPLPYDVYSFHYPPFDGDLASYGNSAFNSASLVLHRTPPPEIPVLADEYAHLPIYNPDELRRDPNVHNFWGESIKYYWEKMFITDGCLGGDIFGEDGSLSGRGGASPPENWLTKKAYSPVRADNQPLANPGPGKPLGIAIKNWFDHTNLNELKVRWSIGAESGVQPGPDVAPHSAGQLEIPARDWRDGDVIHLQFQRASDGLLVEECALAVSPSSPTLPAPQGPAPRIAESADAITVTGGDFTIAFSRQTGLITRGACQDAEIIKGGPYLHVVATDQGKPTVELPAWSLKGITAAQEDKEAVIRISGAYGEAPVDFELRIDGAGLITTKYTLAAFPFHPPTAHPRPWNNSHYGGFSEIGVSFGLTDAVDRLSWRRQALWSFYPDDHVGRPSGVAQRTPAMEQNAPWAQQVGSGHNGRSGSGGEAQGGNEAVAAANDFRAMKENIYAATALVAGKDIGLQAVSDARDAVRLEVVGNGVNMIINNGWNYPQLGNSNFMKPPIVVGDGYTGAVRLRFTR